MTAKSREIMDVSFLSKNVQHFSHTTHTHPLEWIPASLTGAVQDAKHLPLIILR